MIKQLPGGSGVRRDTAAMAALRAMDRGLRAVIASCAALVLPLSLLLFLQWPLRDWLQAYSREANDLAQCLFALYVAAAISYASRRRTHLAADAFALRYSPRVRHRLGRAVTALVLIPWSLYTIYAAWPMVWQSVLQHESFPETFNPGYFIVKLALLLMLLLILLQAIVDLLLDAAPEPN